MPLDDTGKLIELSDDQRVFFLDPLERLGITPVSDAFAERYKVNYKRAWLNSGRGVGKRGPFVWKTVTFEVWKGYLSLVRKKYTLTDFLAEPMLFNGRSSDKTAAPEELVKLATFVERNVSEAEFSVDYFDTDPVLYVHYNSGGAQRACLGIWDRGEIKAIARHRSIGTPSTGLLANLRRWLYR